MEVNHSETPRTISVEYHKPDFKEKILKILGKEQLPQQTFKEIVYLDKEPNSIDVPIHTNEVSQSSDEKLNSNQSSLFENYSARYQLDISTIFGKLERKLDIKKIKDQGVVDAEKFYDTIRSRGINRTAAVNYAVKFSENKLSPEQMGEALERYAKIESNDNINGEVYPHASSCLSVASEIIKLTPEEYQQRLSEVQKYPFLSFYLYEDHDGSQAENFKSFLKNGFSEAETKVLDKYNQFYQRSKDKDPEAKENFYLSYVSYFKGETEERLGQIANTIEKIDEKLTTAFDVEKDSLVLNRELAKTIRFYDRYFDESNKPKNEPFSDLQYYLSLEKNGYKYEDNFLTDVILTDKAPTSDFFTEYFNKHSVVPLSEKLINSFSLEEQKLWRILKAHEPFAQTIFHKRGQMDLLFNLQGQPTAYLFESVALEYPEFYFDGQNNSLFKALTPDLIASFSPEDQKIWKAILNYDKSSTGSCKIESIKFLLKDKSHLDSYVNQQGELTSLFFETFIKKSFYWYSADELFKILTPDVLKTFSDNDQKIWNTLKQSIEKIKTLPPDSVKGVLNMYFDRTLSLEQICKIADLQEKIDKSPSKEILRIRKELVEELIKKDNPEELFSKISDIFIKNNLPEVGKIYKVFTVLYPTDLIKEKLNNKGLSPVLRHYRSSRQIQNILFKDLINVHINSSNRSLRNYLGLFSENEELIDRCYRGEHLDSLETKKLSFFLSKLDTLYDSSLLSRIDQQPSIKQDELTERVRNLYRQYHVKDPQTIGDRVAEMYLSSLGIDTISEAVRVMDSTKVNAHKRNLEYYLSLENGKIEIQEGDLLKGIDHRYLENILENGSVAKEYLGSDSSGDQTPFDTDTLKVSKESIENGIQKSMAITRTYGQVTILVKNRGQFQNTSADVEAEYQLGKLELFSSAVVNSDHYSVRTGFPSSEIDCFIAGKEMFDETRKIEEVYLKIARHGVYIPVANEDGDITFTPSDFERYRHAFDGVDQFNGSPIDVQLPSQDNWSYPLVQKTMRESTISDFEETRSINAGIRNHIKKILSGVGIKLKDQYDTGLLGATLQDIGSTGRNTNLPGDADFDYALILDGTDYQKVGSIIESITKNFHYEKTIPAADVIGHHQIRLDGVSGIAPKPLKIDIGVNTIADTLVFTSNKAVEQKLDSIRRGSGEDVYKTVVANIRLAKKILQQGHAYKKGKEQDGGFAGIGVENWILANNGSIKKAFETFWQAAHEGGNPVSLETFRQKYPILDPGVNIRYPNAYPNNFSYILTEEGYKAMLNCISKYIKKE
jgi:hypothetical protein